MYVDSFKLFSDIKHPNTYIREIVSLPRIGV